MSLGHSPSVVTNGLVMYYDMNNTQKAWKGKPTTNYVIGPNWLGSTLTYNYTGPSGDATYTYVTGVTNPINAPGVMRYYTGAATAYRYWALRGTVPLAGTYTFSYYARVILGGPSNIGNGQLWRDTGTDLSVTGDFNPTFTTEWKRYSTTGTVTSYLDYFPVHSGAILGGFTIEYCGFQLEAGSFATPFVDGARSTTQAILDLTSKNTLTAGSLTYASDNTFSFDGATNYITAPNPITSSAPYTVLQWLKPATALTDTVVTDGTGRKTPFIGASSVWSPGYWMTARNLRVHSFTEYRDHTINLVGDTNWHLFGQWFDGTNCYGILDGVILSGGTRTAYTPGAAASFIIGAESTTGNSYTWNGKVGTTQIYNKALSAAEVAQNFNALRGRYSQ